MCFSFGTARKVQILKNSVPGPGAYQYNVKDKQQAPKYRFGTASRHNNLKNRVPGPGAYEQMSKRYNNFSFGLKLKRNDQKLQLEIPGPGSYAPTVMNNVENQPKYSFMSKAHQLNIKSKQNQPGPGTYEYKSTVIGVPSSIFGKQVKESRLTKSFAPGPGAYKPTRPQSAQNQFGFSRQVKGRFETANTPGPGAYELRSTLKPQQNGTTLSSRNVDLSSNQKRFVPGPGTYFPNYLNGNQSIVFGKDPKSKSFTKGDMPGPGQYFQTFYDKPTNPQYKYGTEKQRPQTATIRSPSPGSYNIPSCVSEGPKYGFGVKSELMQKHRTPGPSDYNPNVKQTLSQTISDIRFGSQNRKNLDKNKNPGPGSYNLDGNIRGPKWGFGTQKQRKNQGENCSPGPGAYTIPPKFAEVPKYLLNNSPQYQY